MKGFKVTLTGKQAKMLHRLIRGCTAPCSKSPCSRSPLNLVEMVADDLKKMSPDEARAKWALYGETLVAVKFLTKKRWKAAFDAAVDINAEG